MFSRFSPSSRRSVTRCFGSLVAVALVACAPASAQTGGDTGGGGTGPGRIAFDADNAVWTVDETGQDFRRVAKGGGYPSISPNGKRIAYVTGKRRGALVTSKLNGSDKENVLRRYSDFNLIGAEHPSWSPDGKRLTFAGYNDGRIYVIGTNGKGLKDLGFVGGNPYPNWSARGEIGFVDVSSLRAINPKTKQVRTIYEFGQPTPNDATISVEQFDWSPDGGQLVFYAPYRIWRINADGSGLTELTKGTSNVEWPTWSPDGSRIAVTANPGNTVDIFAFSAFEGVGSGLFPLTTGRPGSEFYPDWG